MPFQNDFANQIFNVVSSDITDKHDLFDLSEDLMEAMVEFGSETDDNLNCQDHIEYGVSIPVVIDAEAVTETIAEPDIAIDSDDDDPDLDPDDDDADDALSPVYGLKVRGKNILISDVMNALEALTLADLPDEVKSLFPVALNDKEWDAVTRMATMVFLSLERSADVDDNEDDVEEDDD